MTDDYAAAVGLPKDRGEIVQRLEDGGPAAKAGLKRGDIVTKVGGKDVTPQQWLSYLIANEKPGTRSEERRVGKERVRTCDSRWSASHEKKKQQVNNQQDTTTST